MAAVLDCCHVTKFPVGPVEFYPFIYPPDVAQGMCDERIINRVTHQILFAEWNVHSADPKVQKLVLVPEAGDIFEIDIELPQLERFCGILVLSKVQLAE